MSKQYINIAIAGLSLYHSEELKNQLRNLIPQDYIIKWITATDPNIDCLFIHETFYETEGIQRILNKKCFPWLKISKSHIHQKIENNTLNLPVTNHQDLQCWIDLNLIHAIQSEAPIEEIYTPSIKMDIDEKYLTEILKPDNHAKLHLYDSYGTIAIIHTAQNTAWPNPERMRTYTDLSFACDLANTSDTVRISRKDKQVLQDWLWNFYWNSPDILKQILPEDGHYKIHSWPKPNDKNNRKIIFRLSACFIQGGKISKISEQLNIPQHMVSRFIATNIAMNNAAKINIWDKHYTPPPVEEQQEEQGLIKSFFGKLRKKFGL